MDLFCRTAKKKVFSSNTHQTKWRWVLGSELRCFEDSTDTEKDLVVYRGKLYRFFLKTLHNFEQKNPIDGQAYGEKKSPS